MHIDKIKVGNFTVFERLETSFSKGINILIGENGTGKTHLMKMMYAPTIHNKINNPCRVFLDIFTHSTPTESSPQYFKRNKNQKFSIKVQFDNAKTYINNDGDSISPIYGANAIFIPAKEMLSHSKGLLALERERTIPFDRTLIDIVAKAELGESKRLSELDEKILSILSDVIDGKVIYEDDTFFVQ